MNTIHTAIRVSVLILLVAAFLSCKPKAVQPESPQYGPADSVYEVPEGEGRIFYVAPDGKADADGHRLIQPTTIETAISKAVTCDVIIMRGGIYRTGNLTFNQGITIQPYRDEHPVLKGTLVAENWQKTEDSLWFTSWETLFPAGPESWWNRARQEQFTPLHRFNNDGVFIDGHYLQSAGSREEVDEGTFFVDYEAGQIYIGIDPADKLVEITAFRKAIFRTTREVHEKASDKRGPKIYGLEITQYPDTMVHIDGYYPQGISTEDQHGKDVVGTLFENCTFSNCFRIGVFAIGDSLVMRNCLVKNTNTEGVYIVASSDVLLERNIFTYNNIEKWTGFFPAAVKIFNQTHRITCRENKIIDHPFSNGIWYDVGNEDGVFVNNRAENVGSMDKPFLDYQVWPADNAFFFEISKGAVCAGNVFLNCDQVLVLNSCDVKVYNNTFVNTRMGFGRDSRGDNADHFGWHITTGPAVDKREGHAFVNNLMIMDEDIPKPQLYVWQPFNMCRRLKESQLETLDHNIYIRRRNTKDAPLMLWSPAENEKCQAVIHSPQELTELYPDFSKNSRYLEDFTDSVFIDAANGDFHLRKGFMDNPEGDALPEKVIKVMGLSDQDSVFTGAYPLE
ncbi:MAG: right-handed parallel beta-helix repeat-containing protein [Bacteroidales bacterium]|nr:right-handed parallel beta-helix repeat-containing protein [Bacteroidales bacterium]